jgi:uncharacterized protein YbcV (DUF1398 family)
MDIKVIDECEELSLAGKMTFPEVVMKLAATGVERYIVDLVGLHKHTYGIDNEHHSSQLMFEVLPVASKFDAKGVKSAVVDIQQNKINYQAFLHRITSAGCCHYEVYIVGHKVIYFGRDGSEHVEMFPSP